jgi:predicted MFS family arabinose efflux permease
MTSMTGSKRAVFVALLFAAMGAGTLAAPSLGILATFIIDDLSISRTLMGWIIATSVMLAAVLSPATGWVTDRIGGKSALILVFAASSISFVAFGVAPALGVLFIASAISAIANSGANPSTNKLIGEDLPPGERGVTTGIKQSGVQASITAAGLLLPTLAIAFGWRSAMLAVAALPLIGAVVAMVVIPPSDRSATSREGAGGRLPPSTRWLAGYGLLMGFAGAATFFVPLFAEESLGFDPRIGGLAITVIGVVAFASRILWARYAEVHHAYLRSFGIMAIIGVAGFGTMLASTQWIWLLWVGAALTGASTSAWNSVAMLAVINEAGPVTGRASGVVLLGFLAGLGIGPPLYGATVDATGSYRSMWIIAIVACASAAGLVWVWKSYGAASTVAPTR